MSIFKFENTSGCNSLFQHLPTGTASTYQLLLLHVKHQTVALISERLSGVNPIRRRKKNDPGY
jgi:hypothetical protein